MTQTANPRTVSYEAYQRLQERCKQAEAFLEWEDQLFAHENLIPGVKITMRELRRHPPKEAHDKLSPAPIWKIAQNTGISDKTVGKNIMFLDQHKVLRREERHNPQTTQTEVSVQFYEPFLHPKKIDIPTRPKSGYHPPKPTCAKCGDDLEIETAVLCPSCNTRHIVETRPATEKDIELTEKFNELVRIDEQLSEAPDNLSPAPNVEASEEVSDNPYTYRMSEEVSPAILPNTTLDGAVEVSSQDQETETAALLLSLAGDHTEHIKMVPSSDKYITIKKPLQLGDMRAHIRGYKTLGSRFYNTDGSTRGMRYDADTPEQWERCKQAARLLVAADEFKPILEPSPAPAGKPGYHHGGGALWVLFDENVDSYSAKRTIAKFTGSLLSDIKEVWPPETDTGNRARLLGGIYLMKGFKERCKLYTVDGEEITILDLIHHLTPSTVIEAYDKPEPEPEPTQGQHSTPDPSPRGVHGKEDLASQVIEHFNASTSWDELANRCGGFNRRKKFLAIWRGDGRKPNVAVDPKTDLAKDFSPQAWLPYRMDKYQVYCFIEGGENWQEFKRSDLTERCNALREANLAQVPYDPPNRLTMCCNASWHWNGEKYVCAECRGKRMAS